MRGAYKAMKTGYVSEGWAREHHELWYDDVQAGKIPRQRSASHPAADANGYVRTPNVNSFIEMMDMREAQRAYSANLSVLEVTKGMLQRAIEILR